MSDIFSEISEEVKKSEIPNKCIVRLTRSYWNDASGIHMKVSLRYLRRKCSGYNLLEEDCSMAGVEDVMPQIINLLECKNGIYQVVTCNEFSSWETPHILENYDYKLVPVNL